MPFYGAPNETPDRKQRRLHLMATLGGSLAPRGTYGLPSQEQVKRSRAERKRWSRRARLAWEIYWIALLALFAVGIAGLAAGSTWLFLAAVLTGLTVLIAGTAIGASSELRNSRRRRDTQAPHE